MLVTFGGSYLLERARSRRDARQSRDSAIADLLTTSVELVLAVNTIRAAYQHRTNTRARLMIAAALLRDLPNLSSWKDFADRGVQKTILRTTIGLARDQDTESRTIVRDFAGMITPQTSRFFASVTAVTMQADAAIADAARQLGAAGGALLEAAGARKHKHDRARSRFGRELGKFRVVVDQRR